MQIDLFGQKRYKVNLHTHTNLTDGRKSPGEVVQIYREQGYDAIALTDHWFWGDGEENADFVIISGAEYNIGGNDTLSGVYHILCLGAAREPAVAKSMEAQRIIDEIHRAGGMVVLAHPAWSLNTPEQILTLKNVDATEIYNSVSGVHMSRRADSSIIVDMIAARGVNLPLIGDDDAHYYDGTDECKTWIMVAAESNTAQKLLEAVREGRFYATQGPEIHLQRTTDGGVCVKCSPCREIIFHSARAWAPGRVLEGEGLTEASFALDEEDLFIRAEVVDAEGKRAWSNIILL